MKVRKIRYHTRWCTPVGTIAQILEELDWEAALT
jgi:hypothetical protein